MGCGVEASTWDVALCGMMIFQTAVPEAVVVVVGIECVVVALPP